MPENSDKLYLLLLELNSQKRLDELPNYKMIELKVPSGETEIIYYDTIKREALALGNHIPVELRANESPEKAEDFFNNKTLTNLRTAQTIVRNFLILKEDIKRRNPNAKIKIINEVIAVSTNVASAYFLIDQNGEIPLAQAKEIHIPNFARESQKNDYPQKDSNNPFRRLASALIDNPLKKLWLALKRRVLLPKTDDTYVVDLDSNNERSRKQKNFL